MLALSDKCGCIRKQTCNFSSLRFKASSCACNDVALLRSSLVNPSQVGKLVLQFTPVPDISDLLAVQWMPTINIQIEWSCKRCNSNVGITDLKTEAGYTFGCELVKVKLIVKTIKAIASRKPRVCQADIRYRTNDIIHHASCHGLAARTTRSNEVVSRTSGR